MGNLYRSCKNESHQHAPPEPAFNIPKGFKKIGNAYSNGNQIVIEATKTSEGLRVLLGEEDGNYAGGSWAGLFTDPHSAAFFAYALVKRFSNTELDGTMEERNGIY